MSGIRVDVEQVLRLHDFVVRGLVWFHWGVYFSKGDHVNIFAPTERQERGRLDVVLSWPSRSRISCDLGNGTVQYEGTQALDEEKQTAWKISMYGGLTFSDAQRPQEPSSAIGVLTMPADWRDARPEPAESLPQG